MRTLKTRMARSYPALAAAAAAAPPSSFSFTNCASVSVRSANSLAESPVARVLAAAVEPPPSSSTVTRRRSRTR